MKASLRPFEMDDLPTYEAWRAEIDSSRFIFHNFPNAFTGTNTHFPGKCLWWVILADGLEVGMLWLERDEEDGTRGRLGIVIGRSEFWGCGLGRRAIELALEEGLEKLGLESSCLNVRKDNPRAIACYRAVGFEIEEERFREVEGDEGVPFYRMGRTL